MQHLFSYVNTNQYYPAFMNSLLYYLRWWALPDQPTPARLWRSGWRQVSIRGFHLGSWGVIGHGWFVAKLWPRSIIHHILSITLYNFYANNDLSDFNDTTVDTMLADRVEADVRRLFRDFKGLLAVPMDNQVGMQY